MRASIIRESFFCVDAMSGSSSMRKTVPPTDFFLSNFLCVSIKCVPSNQPFTTHPNCSFQFSVCKYIRYDLPKSFGWNFLVPVRFSFSTFLIRSFPFRVIYSSTTFNLFPRNFPPYQFLYSTLSRLNDFLFKSISSLVIIFPWRKFLLKRSFPFRMSPCKVCSSSKYIPIQHLSSLVNILLFESIFPSILSFRELFSLSNSSFQQFSVESFPITVFSPLEYFPH